MERMSANQVLQQSSYCPVSDISEQDNQQATFASRSVTASSAEGSELLEPTTDPAYKKKLLKEYKVSLAKKVCLYVSHIFGLSLGGAIFGGIVGGAILAVAGGAVVGYMPIPTGIIAASGAVVGAVGGAIVTGFAGYCLASIKSTQMQVRKYKKGIAGIERKIRYCQDGLDRIEKNIGVICQPGLKTDDSEDKSLKADRLREEVKQLEKQKEILQQALEDQRKILDAYK